MHAPLLTPEILLRAYAEGLFPMAERRDDPALYWVSPERRGIIPLNDFHVPRRLQRTIRSGRFRITTDRAFGDVMRACATPAPGREQTWINEEILRLYMALHAGGMLIPSNAGMPANWRAGFTAFAWAQPFGESMFSRVRDASKVALVQLVKTLRSGGFVLLDTQFLTRHLATFGAYEIPRESYLLLLHQAIARDAVWPDFSGRESGGLD